MTTHSSILAWRIPMDREVWQATVHGVAKSRTRLSKHTHTPRVPTQVGQFDIRPPCPFRPCLFRKRHKPDRYAPSRPPGKMA